MPYRYLEDIATADVAFEAWAETLEGMFVAAADATMNVMVEDLGTIDRQENRAVSLRDDALDLLLFQFLQELIYYKDAQCLLLRVSKADIQHCDDQYILQAEFYGQEIDPDKHSLIVDVKAVTLHRLSVKLSDGRFQATVVLDI